MGSEMSRENEFDSTQREEGRAKVANEIKNNVNIIFKKIPLI